LEHRWRDVLGRRVVELRSVGFEEVVEHVTDRNDARRALAHARGLLIGDGVLTVRDDASDRIGLGLRRMNG
jgi:hypothetical protein